MVFKATQIAFHYQRQFRKDVFIDMNCFRRWGHNELDDPSFTNPSLYKVINTQRYALEIFVFTTVIDYLFLRTVPDRYKEKLDKDGVFSVEEADAFSQKYYHWLNNELKSADNYAPQVISFFVK
jgi:probable 2-oxoglutarate dehydrogenase E1 component DHKTD1